jgi:predicted lipid-binding transport protein (Tim44 family)
MNKYALSEEEKAVFDGISASLSRLSVASQYNVLRNLAHVMDREVNRIGSVRAAAAVAGSTARVLSEGKRSAKRSSMKTSRKTPGYPESFRQGPGKAALEKQAACKAVMSSPPTEDEKAALRAASEEVRDLFRAFDEGTN